ncbi:hypothetical protein ACIQI7_20925 [Kitasatospora sp. NPDC092039]|uniref:hypothetical protein n=1 Tax=Kitasatospora sp. NPDC092039 TaxID=3364086 RepID=UPI00383051F3
MTHGGIEPARLLLTPTGTVKVLGFGTAAPAPGSDLSALGDTLHELLEHPGPPGPPGELGALVSQLRDAPSAQDPRLTEEFALRLRRLAEELAATEPVEPVEQPRRPAAARPFWIHRRPERLPLGRALAVVIGAGLVAVTAYAIAVTL